MFESGNKLRERLIALSDHERYFRYALLPPTSLPIHDYSGKVQVLPITDGNRALVHWCGNFTIREGDPEEVKAWVQSIYQRHSRRCSRNRRSGILGRADPPCADQGWTDGARHRRLRCGRTPGPGDRAATSGLKRFFPLQCEACHGQKGLKLSLLRVTFFTYMTFEAETISDRGGPNRAHFAFCWDGIELRSPHSRCAQ
ncbi:MAG: SRPBCC family protein [Rhodomicrobiaceae bacterium]